MIISLIAAMSENGVIGNNNALPWHLPEDLKYFKQVTLGKPIIMGRKTYESMGNKPLPGRLNIILTQSKDFYAPGCQVVHSIEAAIQAAGAVEEIMVIGGANIFQQFLSYASRIYLTVVHQTYSGDTYFPNLNLQEWEVVSENNHQLFTVKILNRRKS